MNYIAEAIKALPALLIVLALHVLLLWQVVQHAPQKRVVQQPKPIMISLITPAKPQILPVAVVKNKKAQAPIAKPKRIKPKKPKRIKPKKPKRIKAKKPKLIKPKKPKRIKAKKPKLIKVNKVANSSPSKRAIHQKVSATPQESATKTKYSTKRVARSHGSTGDQKKGGGITKGASYKAAYLHNSYPAYPRMSRRRGEQGKVLLRVKVNQNGSAASVQLKKSSGFKRLDKAAREAVSKWRFIPAKKNGKTVSAWVNIPIVFKLN